MAQRIESLAQHSDRDSVIPLLAALETAFVPVKTQLEKLRKTVNT